MDERDAQPEGSERPKPPTNRDRRAFFGHLLKAAYVAPLILTFPRSAYAQGSPSDPPPRCPDPDNPECPP